MLQAGKVQNYCGYDEWNAENKDEVGYSGGTAESSLPFRLSFAGNCTIISE